MVKADTGDFIDAPLHGQFRVERNAEVADSVHWCDDVTANS